jgi:hypothetical protein
MSEPIDFALKPGARRGDSAFLLNRGRHRLAFDSFPGRMIALAFLGSAADPGTVAALETLAARRRLVEGGKAAFFAVVCEPGSVEWTTLEARFPAVRFLWDGETLASAFGASRAWVILDPMLRVIDVAPLDERDRVLAGSTGGRRARPSALARRRRFSRLPTFSSPSSAAISSTASSAEAAGKAASCRMGREGRSSISTGNGNAGAIST